VQKHCPHWLAISTSSLPSSGALICDAFRPENSSADYINTQPDGPKFKKDFWQVEVTKMIKVYGAPIDDAGKIVDYLAATY
jgi:hypothetical protein